MKREELDNLVYDLHNDMGETARRIKKLENLYIGLTDEIKQLKSTQNVLNVKKLKNFHPGDILVVQLSTYITPSELRKYKEAVYKELGIKILFLGPNETVVESTGEGEIFSV